MRGVGVFPAGVEDGAIVEHGRAPILVLIEAQLADAGAIGIHFADIGDRVAAADTRYALEAAGGGEEDLAAGQIARFEVVHIGFIAGGHLAQSTAVGLNFPDLPAVIFAGHGEQQFVAAEIQFHVAHEAMVFWLQEGGECALRADWGEYVDFVIALFADGCVGLPVLGQFEVVSAAFDQQHFVEIDHGVGEQGIALEGGKRVSQFLDALFGPLITGSQGGFRVLDGFFQLGEAG